MLGKLYEGQDCSAARALEVVGERWSLLILRDAMFAGHTRFSQFHRSLGIATNILAKRLDDFVEAGIMERRGAAGTVQAEYTLTQKGLELKPVIIALTAWGDKWVRPGPIEYRSGSSGQLVELQLRHAGDGRPLALTDVVAEQRLRRNAV
jgi:DNA-binding HxlR family transcriptional regulator